jgi:hypothetical protein
MPYLLTYFENLLLWTIPCNEAALLAKETRDIDLLTSEKYVGPITQDGSFIREDMSN